MDPLISWLLDSPTPSIRYLTLRWLLGRSEADGDVQAARSAMLVGGPIPHILEKQSPAGHWEGERGYYGPKYVSTHWSLILLSELAIDPADSHLRRGVEFMLNATEHDDTLEDRFDKTVPDPDQYGFSCFWGNLLRYTVYCHLEDDPRVKPIVRYLVRNLETGGCRCVHNAYLPCAWGAARALWGLAALPEHSEAVSAAIQRTLDFLLDGAYSLTEGRYPTPGKPHTIWAKLNFPLFYQADVLFVLRVLGELNALSDARVRPALDWLAPRRQSNGRWPGISPYSTRTWRIVEDAQDTSRWVSLQAASVMQQAQTQATSHPES
jgi:hypothetical protein